MTMPPKRWLRFSIRTLLLALLVSGIAFGLVSNRANRQLDILANIKMAGGTHQSHPNTSSIASNLLGRIFGTEAFANVYSVDLRGTDANDELIVKLANLSLLRELDLTGTRTTDVGVLAISRLPLKTLWLQECPITDLSGSHLSKTTTLEMLAMNATNCSDDFIDNLGPLPELKDLGLRGTNIAFNGVQNVGCMPKIESLRLYDTSVNDNAIQQLANNQTLKFIGLSSTSVTDDVFETLRTISTLTEIDLNACPGITPDAAKHFALETKCLVDYN